MHLCIVYCTHRATLRLDVHLLCLRRVHQWGGASILPRCVRRLQQHEEEEEEVEEEREMSKRRAGKRVREREREKRGFKKNQWLVISFEIPEKIPQDHSRENEKPQ